MATKKTTKKASKADPRAEMMMCSIRITRELLDQIDAFADTAGPGSAPVSRNQACAHLMRRGLGEIMRKRVD